MHIYILLSFLAFSVRNCESQDSDLLDSFIFLKDLGKRAFNNLIEELNNCEFRCPSLSN